MLFKTVDSTENKIKMDSITKKKIWKTINPNKEKCTVFKNIDGNYIKYIANIKSDDDILYICLNLNTYNEKNVQDVTIIGDIGLEVIDCKELNKQGFKTDVTLTKKELIEVHIQAMLLITNKI